jgi:hypothetical protein
MLSHGLKYSEVINRSTEMHRQDAKIQLQPLTNVGQIKQRQDVQVAGAVLSVLWTLGWVFYIIRSVGNAGTPDFSCTTPIPKVIG